MENNQLSKAIEKVEAKYCPACDNQTLELYDERLKTIPYDNYILYKEQGINVDLENRDLSHFKCTTCKTVFPVDRSKEFPAPVYDYSIRVQNFQEDNYRSILQW